MDEFNQGGFSYFSKGGSGPRVVGLNKAGWKGLFFVGVCLVLFALLMIAKPELLVYLISSAVMMLGFSIIGVSLTLRKISR
jgi:hypothetical protein